MWGRGHCTTALFFLQGEAAPCKASPFTTKPARVGKPSPRRSPGQPSSSQREGGYSFLYSPLFAFFMCPVSHTFPAYNGNEMPPWYTIIFFVYGRVVYKPRCLPLFFLCGVLRGCAGVEGAFPLWWCSILSQGGKAASPASASPWRTPANRCRTRLFSASKSAGFRGSQQPLGAFPLEEPSADQEPLALLSTNRSSTLPCS